MKYRILSHCTNDSTGEYTIRLQNDDLSKVYLGQDALNALNKLFSDPDVPVVEFNIE